MKKLFLFLTLLFVGVSVNAQFSPSNNLNYVKLIKTPPTGTTTDQMLVYDSADQFVKMIPIETENREAVNDVNKTITGTSNRLVAYTAITADRTVTLPPATTANQRIWITDESGLCSNARRIIVQPNGSDVIGGDAFAVINFPNGSGYLESNGSGKWNIISTTAVQFSAGVNTLPTITDNGNGSVTLGTGVYSLFANTNGTGRPKAYQIAGGTFTFVDGSTNYIYADYNTTTGAVTLQQTTTETPLNDLTQTLVYAAYRQGTTLHPRNFDTQGIALSNKINRSIYRTQRVRFEEGGVLVGESATPAVRTITISAGTVWVAATEQPLSALTSAANTCYHVIQTSPGVWTTSTVVTQYNNTQYNTTAGLQTLNNNEYGVNWLYRSIGTDNDMAIILGGSSYTLGQAQSSQKPTNLPPFMRHMELVGRIIVLKNATTATQIDNVSSTFFTASGVTDHNALNNLQTAQTGVTYGHITDATQTISGVKTFSSSPMVPTPTTGLQAVNKDYTDTKTTILNTISDMLSYTGVSKEINVLEPERGGVFYFVSSGLTADNGVVFPHATSGFWVRRLSGFVIPEFWGTGTTTSFSFIQSALNYAAGKNIVVNLQPKQYNIDDCLIIKSNTELRLDKATIIRLNDNVNKSMLRNFGAVYAGSTALIDSNITISGGTWEGNGANQTLYSSEPSLNVGIELHNAENVRLKDTKINLTRSYATYFSSVKNVFIDRVNVDNGDVKDLNRDGLHFNGPTDNVIINDCVLRGTDDQLAFNANDIDYAYKVNSGGDITNTTVNNVIFDNTYKGIRLLSAENNITRMTIDNLSGTTSGNILEAGNYELGTGGKIDDVIINNLNFNVNQTVNDGRVLFHFRKGGYGKIIMDNIKIGGNHYVNPTFEFLNGVDMDYFKISNLTSFGTDSGAYSDFKVRQGEATFPTIDTFIIDGYNFTSTVAKANKLIDINALTVGDFQLLNSNIDNAESIIYTRGGSVFGKITLENNISTNNTNGIDFTNTTIGKLNIYGDFIKSSGGYAFSKASTSTITETKVNPYVSNTNSDVSSNYYVPYLNNGIAKNLLFANTLTEVLTKGATSALGASIGNLTLSASSSTVPSLRFGNTNFGWGFLEETIAGNLDLSRYVSGVRTSAMLFNRSNGEVTFSNNISTIAATTANHVVIKSQHDLKADIASPTFTGDPKAPTPTTGDNDTSIATTAFVNGIASSGTYTPTYTNTANVVSFTHNRAFYTIVGKVVTITDKVTLSVTNATALTSFQISTPSTRSGSSFVLATGSARGDLTAPVITTGDTTTSTFVEFRPPTGSTSTSVVVILTISYEIP